MNRDAKRSAPLCADLTVPDDNSQTVRTLLSRYLTLQYRDLLRLRLPQQSGEQRALGIVQKHCKQLGADNPGPLLSALRRPTIGGLVRFLNGAAGDTPGAAQWIGHLTALVYAELAIAGAAPPAIVLSPSPQRLILAGAKTMLTLPSGTASSRLHPDGLTYVASGEAVTLSWEEIAAGRTPLSAPAAAPISGGVTVALADDSPLSAHETHPDKQGNAFDLGGHTAEDWVAAMQAGLELVRTGVPAVAAEIELLIQMLVPVGFDTHSHLSASYQEMIGTIYLSLHPEPMTLAEALIHEHSHNKINMLWTMAPVLENAFSPAYPSPFRPDPRPLHGVLLGVHAFLPVERLYEKLAEAVHPITSDPNFGRRRATIRESNRQACETLELYAQPTENGKTVLDEIFSWNAHFQRALG